MNYLKLSNAKLAVEPISDQVASESCGAISMFVGTTRDNFEDKKVNVINEIISPLIVHYLIIVCVASVSMNCNWLHNHIHNTIVLWMEILSIIVL